MPKVKGPMGLMVPILPLSETSPAPDLKMRVWGAWALLFIVPVTVIFPEPLDVSRMIGVRLRGSEIKEAGLEREIPWRAVIVPARLMAAEGPTPI